MSDAAFSGTGSLLEALRFAADTHGEACCAPGYPLVHFLLDTVSLLWQVGEVRDAKVLVAAALHRCPVPAVEAVAGQTVATYVAAAQTPTGLAIPRLERLVPAATQAQRAAGRQIHLAALLAQLRHGLPSSALTSDLAAAARYRGSFPALEAHLATLLSPPPA